MNINEQQSTRRGQQAHQGRALSIQSYGTTTTTGTPGANEVPAGAVPVVAGAVPAALPTVAAATLTVGAAAAAAAGAAAVEGSALARILAA